MNIAEILAFMYPTASPLVDYQVGDDGTGPRIVAWSLQQPQPDSAALTANQLGAIVASQIALIESAYQGAIQLPVAYLGATFQADQGSQDVLAKVLVAGSVPAGMFWLDASNAPVQMSFAQLQGLAGAMLAQGQTAFAKKTSLKQQIRAAQTVQAVQAITW